MSKSEEFIARLKMPVNKTNNLCLYCLEDMSDSFIHNGGMAYLCCLAPNFIVQPCSLVSQEVSMHDRRRVFEVNGYYLIGKK